MVTAANFFCGMEISCTTGNLKKHLTTILKLLYDSCAYLMHLFSSPTGPRHAPTDEGFSLRVVAHHQLCSHEDINLLARASPAAMTEQCTSQVVHLPVAHDPTWSAARVPYGFCLGKPGWVR